MSGRGEVARRPRRAAGEASRERLLAGLPVTERRLDLAGVSTAVLEGGDGPPADLGRIAVPTTLIWGREDRQVRLRVAEAAGARHGWPLRVIEGAADDPAMERPGAFLAALRAALGGA